MNSPNFKTQLSKLKASKSLAILNRFEGALVVCALILIVEVIYRSGNHQVRNFILILQTGIVYAALRGAISGALFAACVAWVYIAYMLSERGKLFTYSADNLERLIVATITFILTGLMVGYFRRKLEQISYARAMQKSAVEKMRDEERYRAFIEQSNEAIWRFELDQPLDIKLSEAAQIEHFYKYGRLAECNRAMATMYGFASPADIEGFALGDFLVREDERNVEYLSAFIQSGYKLENAESHERDKDGRDKYFLNNLVGIIQDGMLVRAWGTQRDITMTRQADEILRRSEWQQRFLSTASGILSSSLDAKKILTTLAQITVPDFADWCGIDLVESDGSINRLAIVHTDPQKVEWGFELSQKYPAYPDIKGGVGAVIKTGKPELIPFISDDILRAYAVDEEHYTVLTKLEFKSILIVPLIAYGNTLGAMSFIYAESGRNYTAPDLIFAEDLANRAASAVFNAKLYEDAQSLALQEFEHSVFLETLLATAPVGLGFLNKNLEYIRINQYLADINGLPIEQHIGRHMQQVNPGFSSKAAEILNEVIEKGRPILDTELSGEAPPFSGRMRHWLASYYPVPGRDGEIIGVGIVVDEITERKKAEETIRHQALHDALTGLPNRKSLEERLAQSITVAKRNKQSLGIIFCDLDRFKVINDTLGHDIGDEVLKEVAQRLKQSVREEDTVARLGGDEFIIMLPELSSPGGARKVADKIFSTMLAPIIVGSHNLHVTVSLGIAFFPEDGIDPATLLKNADTALYRAKEAGRNTVQLYNQTMNLQATERLSLEHDLRLAQNTDQLEMFYQPIIELKTGATVAFEALLRWRHPKLGLMLPHEFIPLAEETGIMSSLATHIFSKSCNDFKKFLDTGFVPGKLVVNLSAKQFMQQDLIDMLRAALDGAAMHPSYLELEITENIAMVNVDFTINKLRELRDMGVSISVDDFGTGYSSLSYLRRLPIHKLKIDKSFTRHSLTEAHDAAIIRAIISMAHSLDLKVTAEGIETDSQLRFIRSLRADFAQGFYISYPLSVQETIQWVAHKKEVVLT